MDTFDTRYFKLNKQLLSFAGLWPLAKPLNKYIFLTYTILSVLLICVTQIAYLLKNAESLDEFYDVLPALSGGCICMTKTLGIHLKAKNFKVLLRHVHNDWCYLAKDEDIRILMDYTEKSRLFTLAYFSFIAIGCVFYVTAPITVPLLYILTGANVTSEKRFPHPSEFFVDHEKYYYYLLSITYVAYVACVILASATDTMFFAMLQHTCGMLAILSRRLENFAVCSKSKCADCDLRSNFNKDIRHITGCVQLQIRIERLIELIDATFDICLITDIGVGVLFQCSSCVMIVTHMDTMALMKNGSLLLLQIGRTFFNCFIGQRIIDHSIQMRFAVYNGLWYETSVTAKKMLVLVIAKCQKPYNVTMAKLFVVSLETFGAIMKMSASYVTLMASLQTDEV